MNRMTPEVRKEAHRRFWMIKGHLACKDWDDDALYKMHESYLKSLWGNEEAYLWEEGFEEAYFKLTNEQPSN